MISDVACNLVNCAMLVSAVTPQGTVPGKWEMSGAMLVSGTADNKSTLSCLAQVKVHGGHRLKKMKAKHAR